MLSAVNVYLPKDRVTNNHQGYGFVEFRTEEDADYVRLMKTAEQLDLVDATPTQGPVFGAAEVSMPCTQAIKVLNMIKVYGKPIRVNKASQDKRSQDIGANLFIGNLDPEVDEKVKLCSNRRTLHHLRVPRHVYICVQL